MSKNEIPQQKAQERRIKKTEFRCHACRNIFSKEEQHKVIGKLFYCAECGRKKIKEDEKNKKIKIIDVPFGTEIFKNNKELYSGSEDIANYETIREIVDYILELFELDPKGYYSYVTFQVNRLVNEFKCVPTGIYLTLKYYFLVLGNPIPNEPHIINIVCSQYNNAMKLYKQQQNLNKQADKLISDKVSVVNVYISKEQRKNYNKSFENKWRVYDNMIDISELGVDDDEK